MAPDYVVGQLVFSKSGRDKGKLFIIISVKDEYIYLVDGKLRKVETPKKKKKKHVQKTKHVIETIKKKVKEDSKLNNAEIRKALKQYLDASSK